MGFKKTNYKIKELDVTLANAYAIVDSIQISGDSGVAKIAIQTSRENAFNYKPLQVKEVSFKVDRTKPIYPQVYAAAVANKIVKLPEKDETGKVVWVDKEVAGLFADWEADIKDENVI